MALSVRMDPLLKKELELAAQCRGITKSQFVIEAVERALGRKNAYELMVKLQAEEKQATYQSRGAFKGMEQSYDADSAREFIRNKLRKKHGVGSAG